MLQSRLQLVVVAHTINPRQRQEHLCVFKVSWIYILNSGQPQLCCETLLKTNKIPAVGNQEAQATRLICFISLGDLQK